MLQWLLRGLVVAVLRRLFVIGAAPFVLLIATPIIFVRASVLASWKQQRFKFAVFDGYGAVWDGLVAAFMWPFYSDMDRLEAARRRSSNQSLEPTAGRRDAHI
jgi:hypothetical protein